MMLIILFAILVSIPLSLSQETTPPKDFIGWLFNSISGLWEYWFGGNVIISSQENKLIISKSLNNLSSNGIGYNSHWVVNHTTDDDFYVQIENKGNKSTEICLIPKDESEFIKGNKEKKVYDKFGNTKAKLDNKSKNKKGKFGYCYSTTNEEDYIRFGENSTILIYQNESKVIYDFDYGQTNFTLLKNNQLVSENLFVYWNNEKYKFGANDSENDGLRNYTYLVNSTNELVLQDQSYYAGENYTFWNETICNETNSTDCWIESKNLSIPIYHAYPLIYNFQQENGNEVRFVYDFVDICSKDYSNCSYKLSNDKKSAIIDFVSDKYIDPTAGATNVSDCITLNSANTYYQLNASISNNTMTTDCIIVSNQNITFDCDGYSITFTGNFSGFYSNQLNTTVENCNISAGSGTINTNSVGIEFAFGANYGIIFNNNATSVNGYGISLSQASNNNLTSNNAIANLSSAIVVQSASGNILKGNNATSYVTLGGASAGIYFLSSSNSTLENNYGSTIGSAYGGIMIYLNSNNNVLINNTGTSSSSVGIYINSANYVNLTNNTGISDTSYGIEVSSGNFGYLVGNNGSCLRGTTSTDSGIYLIGSSNNIILNNIGYLNSTNSNKGGIAITSSSNNNIITGNNGTAINTASGIAIAGINNTVTNNTGYSKAWIGVSIAPSTNSTYINNNGTSNSYVGVYMQGGSGGNNLTSNYGNSNQSYGILITSSHNNLLTNNTGISNSSYGIYISSSNNNTLISNTGFSNSSAGISLQYAINDTLISNNGTSNSNYGLLLFGTNGSKFYSPIAIGDYGIFIDYGSINNTFQDCINITGRSADILLNVSSIGTFINCSYRTEGTNESVISGSYLIRKWYYSAYVNDSSVSGPLDTATVTAYNSSNSMQINLTTNSTGFTPIDSLTEYINNNGTITYYSNYTISATKSGYTNLSHNYNISVLFNIINDPFQLNFIPISPPVLTITYPLATAYITAVTQLNYTMDFKVGTCWYSYDNGITNSSTVSAGTNFTGLTAVEGYNTWTLFCNNTFAINSTSVTFSKNTLPTSCSLIEDKELTKSTDVKPYSQLCYKISFQ